MGLEKGGKVMRKGSKDGGGGVVRECEEEGLLPRFCLSQFFEYIKKDLNQKVCIHT